MYELCRGCLLGCDGRGVLRNVFELHRGHLLGGSRDGMCEVRRGHLCIFDGGDGLRELPRGSVFGCRGSAVRAVRHGHIPGGQRRDGLCELRCRHLREREWDGGVGSLRGLRCRHVPA